jgi:uncharacterized protein YqeY
MAEERGEGLRDRLRRALPAAMKARDRPAVAALRSALAAIDNAEAVEAAAPPTGAGTPAFAGTVPGVGAAEAERRRLTPGEMEQLLRAEVADREAAARTYEQAGQAEQAARLRTEARILGSYLDGTDPPAG